MGQKMKDAIVQEVTKEILRLSEELVDQVLFGDIHEIPLEILADKVDLSRLRNLDAEAYTRVSIAALIRKKFGGPKHAARPPHQSRRSRLFGTRW